MADNSLNNSDDRRQELYERFRADLKADRRAVFYDEGDLIEIFDYASDIHDRYTALEVLFCAERLYPSSVALAERRVLFYLNIDDEAGSQALEQLPDDSVIKQLGTLRVTPTGSEEVEDKLDSLLERSSEFTDEEIIQLCTTAEDLGVYEWLVKNRKTIAAKTPYPPTFLYELSQILVRRDSEEALRILEELTMMEPFSIDFWLLIAEIYLNRADGENVMAALEYALAIDPANTRALIMKAQITSDLNYPSEQIEEILKEVMIIDPDIPAPYYAMGLLKGHGGNPREGLEIVRDYDSRHPGSPQTLDVMLVLADSLPEETLPEMSRFLSPQMGQYYDNFIDMARRHADEGRHRSAAMLLMGLEKAYKLTNDFDFLMEELYRAGMYEEVMRHYQDHYKDQDSEMVQIMIDELNECFAAFWFILAAIRSGITEGLSQLVSALSMSSPVVGSRRSIDDVLESHGLAAYLDKINNYLSGDSSLTPDDLDPFAEDPATTSGADSNDLPF